ncbi:Protein of unknown function [Desulfotomaculum arcticum]|uniref:DUF2953 domain-containing protein n=1 Tax=Desulfotruncus arcticus DSM 17038 TaxID=1121424 RepID=A0A1I2MSS3_9FIRM|nr:DUF2953 domain-containing protein [Desulfotruncus arcticus]SFF94522.1 Protein of unknown function [Desulfotomaculum arcticum] [Desulfotruncus arcticus DSM 17038]
MWLLIFFLTIVGFLALALISPVQINFRYVLDKGNIEAPDGVVELSSPGTGVQIKLLWGLIKFRLRLSSASLGYRALKPILKLRARITGRQKTMARKKARITPERAHQLYKLAVKIYNATLPANKYFLGGVTVHRFSWRTGISLFEADQTGLAVGGLWFVKSNLSAQIYRLIKKPAPRPELEVQPLFKDQLILWVRLNFDFSIRMSRMVAAGLLAAWLYLTQRRS